MDLDKAPIDDRGLVRFAADFMILKPREMERGNRRVFYDYGNRGHKRALQFFNDAPHSNAPIALAHAGNGFFMRRGYAVAWLAWEGDMLPGDGRMVLDVPVASDNGHADHRTGARRVHRRCARHHLLPAERQDRGAQLFDGLARHARGDADAPALSVRSPAGHPERSVAVRVRRIGCRRRDPVDERAVVPSARHIHLPAGFQPGWIYELVYTAKDPLVHGLGHVAVRDFVSFLKYAERMRPASRTRCAAWRRRMPGAARRPGAACATSSIAASMPMRRGGACSTACCRMSPAPGASG